MTTINTGEYFKLKADVDTLSNAVTDKRVEIESLHRQISETKTHITEINSLLSKEDRELSRPGPLSRVTLSSEQYNEHKRTVTEMEAELPVLNEAMVMSNRDLTMLQNDFGDKNRLFKYTRTRMAAAMADQAAKMIVELAGEQIKGLMYAMVASGGKGHDNFHPNKQLFLNDLGERIRDALCQGHAEGEFKTSDWLPPLQEANQHVEAQLHQIHLAEQGALHGKQR